ncbi:MAG: ATP-dependent protease ATPase subunit HslU [Planctomycetes bacterium]|nr:ATP-dependent protease ATPase subunit HslU [Planctomycetota bacterium]NOG55953.1 ATP-dependent protease ATPase subunit HslU [Planctomycetota bacterium]
MNEQTVVDQQDVQPDVGNPDGELTPRQIVTELDKYIIGQDSAKRAVAVAVRNRWRRRQLPESLAVEVSPKNIIMVGPTGVGKTEVARRLAKLVQAPFIKVEASKYTEVGYHGRDVESMIRDLLDIAINMVRAEQATVVQAKAEAAVEQRLVSLLLTGRDGPAPGSSGIFGVDDADQGEDQPAGAAGGYVSTEDSEVGVPKATADEMRQTRELMLDRLRQGRFDEREIEITISERSNMPIIGAMGPDQLDPGMQAMLEQLIPSRHKTRRLSVAEAKRLLLDEETDKLIDQDKILDEAIERTEQSGIIFLDEIDKIASSADARQSADVSRQGVQRDLLPIVEGSTVVTRHGMVKTDHILFIAAGAFHSASISDLMPELQGRFPIRVELAALTREDFIRILKEPDHSLLKQQRALLETEGLAVEFDDAAVDLMADIAAKANSTMENIGARRLMTVVERLFETINFDAPEMATRGETAVRITVEVVTNELAGIVEDEDLSRFVL